jgi:hypothetical protein
MREQNENFNARFDFPQPIVKILSWCTLAGASQKHLCSWRFFWKFSKFGKYTSKNIGISRSFKTYPIVGVLVSTKKFPWISREKLGVSSWKKWACVAFYTRGFLHKFQSRFSIVWGEEKRLASNEKLCVECRCDGRKCLPACRQYRMAFMRVSVLDGVHHGGMFVLSSLGFVGWRGLWVGRRLATDSRSLTLEVIWFAISIESYTKWEIILWNDWKCENMGVGRVKAYKRLLGGVSSWSRSTGAYAIYYMCCWPYTEWWSLNRVGRRIERCLRAGVDDWREFWLILPVIYARLKG